MMNIPASVSNLIKLFSVLLLISILFANIMVVILFLVPFLWMLAGFFLNIPSGVAAKRTVSRHKLYVEDLLQVTIEVEIKSGVGVVMLSDLLPSHFQLMEGSNFTVMWKGFGVKTGKLSYTVKCTTSGTYHLNGIKWESMHCLYRHSILGECAVDSVIEVGPRLLEMRKLRSSSSLTKIPMPLGAVIKNGIPTLDFKEIRRYTYGDSFKYINWKATARNVYRGSVWPVINEYDKEGKRAVWIFLDRFRTMGLGTNIKNAFEYGLEAVNGLADYYLKQQCFVGFCTYNGDDIFVYPGSGKKQHHRILKELIHLNTMRYGKKENLKRRPLSLGETVLSHKKYMEGSRPLFIVVTKYSRETSRGLEEGLLEMAKYTPNVDGRYQVMVINIEGYSLAAESDSERIASQILEIRDKCFSQNLRKYSIWIDWNPLKSSFSNALLKQVVKS